MAMADPQLAADAEKQAEDEGATLADMEVAYNAVVKVAGKASPAATQMLGLLQVARDNQRLQKPIQAQVVVATRRVQQSKSRLDKAQARASEAGNALAQALSALKEAEAAVAAAQESYLQAQKQQVEVLARAQADSASPTRESWLLMARVPSILSSSTVLLDGLW